MALPENRNLVIYKGDTFSLSFRLRQKQTSGAPGAYVDLTGCTPKAQIRATEDSTTVLQEFTATLGDQTNVDTVGQVNLVISSADTANLSPGVWDVQVTYPDNTVTTYLRGSVTVTKEVTRA